MKVIIVTPYFYPHVGGVEAYTQNMARELKNLGWQVVIVTTKLSNSEPDVSRVDGIKVYRLNVLCRISNTPLGVRWKKKLKDIYEIEKPDVINGHTPVPYLADVAERASGSIPFVLTYHNDIGKEGILYKTIAQLTYVCMTRPTLKHSQKIIATSEYYVKRSTVLAKVTPKISIVPPGVDVSIFNTEVRNNELMKHYQGNKVVLFVGSLQKSQMHKGLNTLISAFAEVQKTIPSSTLVIVGDGDAQSLYQQQALASGLKDKVDFTGFIKTNQLAQYYKLADVLVMPSQNNNEGFGMVFIEAGATGTPVIGTKVGGIPYAIKDFETGLLIKPNDVGALSGTITKLLKDKKLADKLGKAGAIRAADMFNWQKLAGTTATVLADAQKPTIVQVAGYYPPHLGGMEKVAQIVSENLAMRGHSVLVITSNIGSKLKRTPSSDKLKVIRLKAFEFAHTPITPGFLPTLWRIPKHSIIHLHLAQAYYPELVLLVSKLRRIPYVVHFHLDLQPTGILGPVFLLYKKLIISTVVRQASQVIVFSEEQQNFIHEKYGVNLKDIAIIPNGVSEDYFKEPHLLKREKQYNVVYVGRLSLQKRVNILIEMLMYVKSNLKLTIIGDGEERIQLEGLANMLNLKNVKFVGQIEPEDIIHYFRAADILVLASENEGMPLAVLEAMASGLPIVGTDVPGIRELVKNVGVLVSQANGKAFARSVDRLLSDPEKYTLLAKKSVETARSYSWANAMDAFEELYQRVEQ